MYHELQFRKFRLLWDFSISCISCQKFGDAVKFIRKSLSKMDHDLQFRELRLLWVFSRSCIFCQKFGDAINFISKSLSKMDHDLQLRKLRFLSDFFRSQEFCPTSRAGMTMLQVEQKCRTWYKRRNNVGVFRWRDNILWNVKKLPDFPIVWKIPQCGWI